MKPVSVLFRGGVNDGQEFSASLPDGVCSLQDLWREAGATSLELDHGAVHSTAREHIAFNGVQPAKETQPAGGKYAFSIDPGTNEAVVCEWHPHNQAQNDRPLVIDILEYLAVDGEREFTKEQADRLKEVRTRVEKWVADGYIMTGYQSFPAALNR